jgi:hypothetical protein
MNSKILSFTASALLPAALLAFTSCSSTPKGPEVTQTTTVIQTENGAAIVDAVTLVATVTGIDPAKRQVALLSANGFKKTVTCGKSVINFDQIKVGDQVKVKATEEFAVFLRPTGTPTSVGEGAAVALAPKGAMPGGLVASTKEVTAKITAIDATTRQVTLRFVDGSTKQIKVGPNVNLAAVNVGDDVTVQVAESLALSVARP